MNFNPVIPGSQRAQYKDWKIVYSPLLSVNWLYLLLDLNFSEDENSSEAIIKENKVSLVAKLDSDLGFLVAKQYLKPSLKTVFLNSMTRTSAHKSWCFAHYLRQHGLNTPEPLAFIEESINGLKQRAWYVSRFDGGTPCDDYFLNAKSITPAMANSASAIVDMFVRLKECQLTHGDIKASNILITEKQPTLLDLDCMKYHRSKKHAQKMWRLDIDQFMNNWRERYIIYRQFQQTFAKQGIEV